MIESSKDARMTSLSLLTTTNCLSFRRPLARPLARSFVVAVYLSIDRRSPEKAAPALLLSVHSNAYVHAHCASSSSSSAAAAAARRRRRLGRSFALIRFCHSNLRRWDRGRQTCSQSESVLIICMRAERGNRIARRTRRRRRRPRRRRGKKISRDREKFGDMRSNAPKGASGGRRGNDKEEDLIHSLASTARSFDGRTETTSKRR